jgi:hypothetical protein
VTAKSFSREVSRRALLAGLGATPIVTASALPSIAQNSGLGWTAEQAQAALKDAKGTKSLYCSVQVAAPYQDARDA